MCEVCIAEEALEKGGTKIEWNDFHPIVFFEAVGKSEGKAKYRIWKNGEKRPRKWELTGCLANVAAIWGFDVNWAYVKRPVKRWLAGEKNKPTYQDLEELW